jgi:hypothetical protein
MLQLRIRVQGSEPYKLGDLCTLEEAIAEEATNVVSEAGSDELSENSDMARDDLERKVIAQATNALRRAGDTYTDPIGVVWELEEVPTDPLDAYHADIRASRYPG